MSRLSGTFCFSASRSDVRLAIRTARQGRAAKVATATLERLTTDLKRNHFSDGDDFFTLTITNQLIDTHLDNIADAIVKVVVERSK